MAMRRSFLLAALALAAPLAAITAAHGCSSEQPFESVCLWVDDPNNCYRKFHQDAVQNQQDCKPQGEPTPAVDVSSLGTPNGAFLTRTKLDTCFIAGGGQVVIDPPIDLTMFPPSLTSDPVTRKFTLLLGDGSECGNATYTSPHGFSFTINAPPDSGAPATTGSSSSSGGVDAGTSMPYGTYTEFISPGREAFDVTCPSGESHHFDLAEVTSPSDGVDGGPVSSCPALQDIVPRASLIIVPGGVDAPGAVSFTIVWPPDAASTKFPNPDAGGGLQSGTPVPPQLVTYFNCSIPGALETCVDLMQDGSETDVDCGGPEVKPNCPARCGDAQHCVVDCDCDSARTCNVVAGVRVCGVPEAGVPKRDCSSVIICQDQKKDGDETDIDCGGSCAGQGRTCAIGQTCAIDTDCTSGICFQKACVPAHCSDTKTNFGETDKDCGGTCDAQGKTCADGLSCVVAADCMSNVCKAGKCSPKDCTTACGVGCPGKPCTIEQPCATNADCSTNACLSVDGGLVCVQPSCTDKTLDGDETDVDCGGTKCDTDVPAHLCADGQLCQVDGDCLNGVCGVASATTCPATQIKKCFPTSCRPGPGPGDAGTGGAGTGGSGGTGGSSGADAGVQTCAGMCALCNLNDACTINSDCVTHACLGGVCVDPDCNCNDKAQDGSETDVDCGGGGQCNPCNPGKKCILNSDCVKDPAAPPDAGPLCFNNVCQ